MASLIAAFLALFLVGLTYAGSPTTLGGGFGASKDADADVQKAVDAVADQIRTKAKLPSGSKLTALRYRSQAVAGINYIVEMQAGDAKVIHAIISADLEGKVFTLIRVMGDGGPLTQFSVSDIAKKGQRVQSIEQMF